MTALRLSKQGGAWVLDGTGARLTTGFSMRRGTVTLDGRAWTIETSNPWRSRVTLSESEGVTPSRSDGEGDTLSEGERDTLSESGGDTRNEGDGDALSEGDGAGASDGAVVRLDPDGSWVPGESGPVTVSWETERGYRGSYCGRLDGPHGVVEIRLPRRGRALELSVTGSWSRPVSGGDAPVDHPGRVVELVVLSAAFALLTQRRRDLFRAATIASVSHH